MIYKTLLLSLFKGKPFVGRLDIIVDGKTHTFGSGPISDGSEKITLTVHDKCFFKKIILFGDIGMGESYFLGYFTTSNLEQLLTRFVHNGSLLPSFPESKVSSYLIDRGKYFSKILHKLNKNTKAGSKKNISKHYDISNDFYALWLDSTMTYSSALFEEGMSLQQAQENKYNDMCKNIGLKGGDHILEIGTGRGGFSLFAVKNYNCKVTTVTISKEQYDYAKKVHTTAGVSDAIDLKLQDYRDVTGQYDHIVSVEMMEALGHEYVSTFVKKCESVLKPGGKICYQCITMPDEHFPTYLKNQDYIQKHIFPGGELISVGQVSEAVHQASLHVKKIAYFGASYVQTLHAWLDGFRSKKQEIISLGFDEQFIKKREYYFIYCAVGFATEYIDVAHITVEKR